MKLSLTVAALTLCLAAGDGKDEALVQDFSKELSAPWKLSGRNWKVEEGELRGTGDGWLEYAGPLPPDFSLSFKASTDEKANVEVKLYDAKDERELYTFAFLGRYHTVLDGVKSCILKGPGFVNVDSKMWIFPGRSFEFEVRRAKNQQQMFLNGVLGPFYVDETPPPEGTKYKLRILVSIEGKDSKLRIDDVRIVPRKG